MVAYADLVLPDTTYLERWDCISLLDRPICSAEAAGRFDPPAGGAARPRRAAVPGRAARARRAARPARLDQGRRQRRAIRAATPTTWSTTSARPASARWPAGAATDGDEARQAARPTPTSSQRYIENGCFWQHELPHGRSATSSTPTRPISTDAASMGWIAKADADRAAALQRAAAEVPPRRAGPWRRAAAGRAPRAHREPISTRCRSGTRRSRSEPSSGEDFPLHAVTQRPMRDVPFLGLAERLAAPDPRRQPALHAPTRARRKHGIADDDWVWVTATTAASRGRCG